MAADPERTVFRLRERRDSVARERFLGTLIEDVKMHTVEASEPTAGAEPQVAVACLQDRMDRAVRQAVLLVPNVVDVLRERLSGIEPLGRGRSTTQAEHEHSHRPNGY